MTRPVPVILFLSALAASGCVPAEYRQEADLSGGADMPEPQILPLGAVLPPSETVTSEAPEAQASLEARNEALARRASSVAAPQAPEADASAAGTRAMALRDRAAMIRARE